MFSLKKFFGFWNLVILICLGFRILSLEFNAKAAIDQPTPYPTSPYTCIQNGKTCMSGHECYSPNPDLGSCPRGEVCCAQLDREPPAGATASPTPQITPFKIPGTDRWSRCTMDDEQLFGKDFHPLRPYPASPCASHLIPIKFPEAQFNKTFPDLWQTFSCGKSANPGGQVTAPGVVIVDDARNRFPYTFNGWRSYLEFLNPNTGQIDCRGWDPTDAYGIGCYHFAQAYNSGTHQSYPFLCDEPNSPAQACFLGRVIFDVLLDYTDLLFPILGNTKDPNLTDRTKLNNYLSWYLNGAVLDAEERPLDISQESDIDRLINFSGPVRKQLSAESMESYREVMRYWLEGNDIHNYADYVQKLTSSRFESPYFELATEEDVVSEVQPGLNLVDQPHEPEIDGRIVMINLRIGKADSRIYFPHLKNSLALSDYLMGTYKPAQESNIQPGEAKCLKDTSIPENICPSTVNCEAFTTPETCMDSPSGVSCCTWTKQTSLDQMAEMRKIVTRRFTLLQGFGKKVWDPKTGTFVNYFMDNADGDSTKVYFEWWEDLIPRVPGGETNYRSVSRNTEVEPFAPAPDLLFENYADRFPSITSQRCDITPSVGGPGDTLVGGKIGATLTIYQAFRYKPDGIVMQNPRLPDNACLSVGWDYPECKEFGNTCGAMSGGGCGYSYSTECCYGSCPPKTACEAASTAYYCAPSGSCGADQIVSLDCGSVNLPCCYREPQPGVTPKPDPPTCRAWPKKDLNTAGRIAIYIKVPFVESLYKKLVEKPDSLIRRFLPYNAGLPTPTPHPNAPSECVRKDHWDCNNEICSRYKDQSSCQSSIYAITPNCCIWQEKELDDFLKTGNKAIVGQGSGAKYSAEADTADGANVKNVTVTAGSGGAPAVYYPKIGSLFEYLLGAGKDPLNLQCLFRPQGYCSTQATISCNNLPAQISKAATGGNCGICNSDLGPLAQQILTAAGETFNVPASAIYATMLHEGATWPEYQGQFTDENVCAWIAPVSRNAVGNMPKCDNTNPITQAPFGWLDVWFYASGIDAPWSAISTVDPSKNTTNQVSRCNFLDAAFATAKALQIGVGSAPYIEAVQGLSSCEGTSFSPTYPRPIDCNWNDQQFAFSQIAYAGYCPANPNGFPYTAIPNYLQTALSNFHKYKCN